MKKTLALILSALMLVSVMAVSVFAGAANFSDSSKVTSPGDHLALGVYDSVASRIATQGTGGMTGLQIWAAGTEGAKFSVKVYTWQYNYDYTVSQEPITVVSDITLTSSGGTWYPVSFESPLPADDYLFVFGDVVLPEGGWAVCLYPRQETEEDTTNNIRYYRMVDGRIEATNGALQLIANFESGGWITAGKALPADEASPVTTDATTTEAPTTAAPGTAGSSDNAGDSAETSDNVLVASLAAVAVMGLAVACVAKKKQH